MIRFQRGFVHKAVHDHERRFRALGHPDGHRAVEFDDRRTHQRRRFRIESRYARPVGIISRHGVCVAGDDRRLEGVKTAGSAELARSPKRLHSATDLELVPERAVLLAQKDGLTRGVGARRYA